MANRRSKSKPLPAVARQPYQPRHAATETAPARPGYVAQHAPAPWRVNWEDLRRVIAI